MTSKVYFATANYDNKDQNVGTNTPTANNGTYSSVDSFKIAGYIPMFQPTNNGTDIRTTGVCANKHCPYYDDPTVMYADETNNQCLCADVLRYGQPYSMLISNGSSGMHPVVYDSGNQMQTFWLNYLEPGVSGEAESSWSVYGTVNLTSVGKPYVSLSNSSVATASTTTVFDWMGQNAPPRYAYFTFHSPIFPDGMPIKAGPQGAFYIVQHVGDNQGSGNTLTKYKDIPTVWGSKFAQSDTGLDYPDCANYRYYNWICAQSYDAIPYNAGAATGAGVTNNGCIQHGGAARRGQVSNNADFNAGGQYPPLFYFDVMWLAPNFGEITKAYGNIDSDSHYHNETEVMTAVGSAQLLSFFNRQRFAKSPNHFPDQQPYVMATLPYALRSTVGWYIHIGNAHSGDCSDIRYESFNLNNTDRRQRLDSWATLCGYNGSHNWDHYVTSYYPFSTFQVFPYPLTRPTGASYEPDTFYLGKAVSNTCSSDDDCKSCDGSKCVEFKDSSGNVIAQKCIPTGTWNDPGNQNYVTTKQYCAPVQTIAGWGNVQPPNSQPFFTKADYYLFAGIGFLLLIFIVIAFYYMTLYFKQHKLSKQITERSESYVGISE